MPFERFIPATSAGPQPKATIRPTGLISFDNAGVKQFGLEKMTHAQLFFDKTRKLIGVRFLTKSEDGAFKLSRRKRAVSLKAPAFFERYALAVSQAQKLEARLDSSEAGMVTIDVKGVQRRRGRPRKAK